MKNEKFGLAILLVVSLLLSTYLFFKTYIISHDGAFQFIPMAKVFASGLLKDAIGYGGQQPLYSFLIAFISRWVSDFETAGKLVSFFFGILIIFPVYFFGKNIFDQKIAFFSTFFLVIHPYIRRFSADVLKESTFLFFLATAIWFSWRTIQSEKRYPYLFVPIFSVLAYLVRPDGVEILLVVFFYVLFIKKFSVSTNKWIVISLLLLSSAFLFLPYLNHLRELTGEWTLSRFKSIRGFLGWGSVGENVSLSYKILFSLKKLNFEMFSIYHPLYVFLLAVGLFKSISSNLKNGEKFLLSFFILHYVVLFLLILNITEWSLDETGQIMQFSGRHVLPLLLFSIYWVGKGFLASHMWIHKKMESRRILCRWEPERTFKVFWIALVILVLAIVLPKTLKPQRYERLSEKWAGTWIKNRYGKGVTIFTTVPRVAYYADGNYQYIDFEKDNFDKIKASMVDKGALYLAVRGREVIDFPEKAQAIERNFIEIVRYEEKGMEKIIVYQRVK